MDAPGAEFLAHSVEGVLADRREECSEHAGSVPGRGFPGTEGIAQERERGRAVVTLAALAVLAVHDPGLIRVQLQPGLRHPLLQRGEGFPGLPLRRAVHHRVIGVALELNGRELSFQPLVEHVVHEQVGEHGADHAPNAMGNFCFDVTLSYRRLELPRRVPAGL